MSAHTESWPRPHRLTVDDYYRMAEAGVLSPDDRTELIEGEIIDMAPIGSAHADVVMLLTKRLFRAVGDSAEVRAQVPVRLSLRSSRSPISPSSRQRPQAIDARIRRADDVLLLIEVSDTTLRYDLDVKARLYATHGIPEYWVVDLVGNRVGVIACRAAHATPSALKSRRARSSYRASSERSSSRSRSSGGRDPQPRSSRQRSLELPGEVEVHESLQRQP